MLTREQQREKLMDDMEAAETATIEPETEPSVGWVEAQQQTQPCHEIGRRHSYKGSDTCLKCGFPKPVHVPRGTRTELAERAPRGSGETIKLFRGTVSMAWMAMGIGVEHAPWEQTEHVTVPVGRTLQFQAPIAGTRITNALRKTPAWKPILAMLRAVGPWADLAPLIAPPLLVGLMAQFPQLQERLMPMAVGMLLPIIAETASMAEEQAELMANMNKFNQEAINEAMGILGGIFEGSGDNQQSPNGPIS